MTVYFVTVEWAIILIQGSALQMSLYCYLQYFALWPKSCG